MPVKRLVVGCLAASLIVCFAASIFFVGHAQSLPAPTVDRVGFPAGYKDTFHLLYTFDNYQNRQIRKVYGNDTAASVSPGQVFNFPYGSIILFESYGVQEDSAAEPVLDTNGRFIPATLTTVFVMRKEQGFGVDYKELRNGEWEYASYRPDGTTATAPAATGSCALCHLSGGSLSLSAASRNVGAQWDYVFRPDLYFSSGSGAVPKGVMQHYVFVPSTIHAQSGDTVTVYNYDQLIHRIVADDGSFDAGVMNPGSSFTVKAGAPGAVISYHCTIHSRMKGSIIVDDPPLVLGITGLAFSPSAVRAGSSFSAAFSGSNITDLTYFDLRYRAPGSTTDQESPNWQKGVSGSHVLGAGATPGTWMVTGARPHQNSADHSGNFAPLSATLTVSP
jgi:plastocyanin